MTSILVDSNVVLDLLTHDRRWFEWSSAQMRRCASLGQIIVNPIVYAETSARFLTQVGYQQVLDLIGIETETLPWDAAFEAGRIHAKYRQNGGIRDRMLPDFLIGAHALMKGYSLLTRDARRYRTYFTTLDIIAPDTHP